MQSGKLLGLGAATSLVVGCATLVEQPYSLQCDLLLKIGAYRLSGEDAALNSQPADLLTAEQVRKTEAILSDARPTKKKSCSMAQGWEGWAIGPAVLVDGTGPAAVLSLSTPARNGGPLTYRYVFSFVGTDGIGWIVRGRYLAP